MHLKANAEFNVYNLLYVEMLRDEAYILSVLKPGLVATSHDANNFQNAVFKG